MSSFNMFTCHVYTTQEQGGNVALKFMTDLIQIFCDVLVTVSLSRVDRLDDMDYVLCDGCGVYANCQE